MKEEKIFCPQCGDETNITSKFCVKCGTKLDNSNSEGIAIEEKVEMKKPKNKKLFVGIAVAASVILLLSFLAPSIFAIISPDKYVKSIIAEALLSLKNENKKFEEVPSLITIFGTPDKNSEKELYLKIDSISDSSMTLNDLNLDDYGLKMKIQSNKEKDIANLNLALLEGKNNIVDGTIYFNEDNIAFAIPKLFNDILGLKFNDNQASEGEDDGLNYIRESLEYFSKSLKSSLNINKTYTELLSKHSVKFNNKVVFKKSESDKGMYTATIKGDDLGLFIKDFIIELVNNKDFKEYLITYMQASDYSFNQSDREYYIESVENIVNSMPEQIESTLEDITIEDLVINAEIENNSLKSIDMSTGVLNNNADDEIKIKLTMDNIKEKDRKGIDFKFRFGAYDEVMIIGGECMFVKDDKDFNRVISANMNDSSSGTVFSYSLTSKLKDNKKVENLLTINLKDEYDENVKIEFESLGSYKNRDRIDYENISLSIYSESNYLEADIKLSGYASKTNIKSLNKVDSKKITYIDDMDEMELQTLGEEVYRNLQIIMTEFEGII